MLHFQVLTGVFSGNLQINGEELLKRTRKESKLCTQSRGGGKPQDHNYSYKQHGEMKWKQDRHNEGEDNFQNLK